MHTFKKIYYTGLYMLALYAPSVWAATTDNTDPANHINIKNPFVGGGDLLSLMNTILQTIIMPIAAVVAVLYIIWAGFQYVQAQGKPAEIQKANRNLLWVAIGVGVLLGAAGISQVLQNTIAQFMTN